MISDELDEAIANAAANHEPKEIVLAEELIEDLFRVVFRLRRLLVESLCH